jgi:hypothetical protein
VDRGPPQHAAHQHPMARPGPRRRAGV